MINRAEIDKMANRFGVHSSHVQRDYVHGWLLCLLYSSSDLASRLVLKGGNCLRKGYFENSRYSRDLDFTTDTGISHEEIATELNAICSALAKRSGIFFDTTRTRVKDKKSSDSEKTISEARLYFRDFYGNESELVLSVRLDVTQFDRLHLPVQTRNLIHPYSDSNECKAAIKCVKLEEALATKMRCLLQRRHIADLFDLAYATIVNKEIEIKRSELIRTFFEITIFRSIPRLAKGLLVDLPLESLGRFWSKYIDCPRNSRFGFQTARAAMVSLVEELIPGPAIREYSDVFFPSSLRNPIMQAGESLTHLRLRYSGIDRLVEPYELAFKIRKDGVAREYFYAYDTTEGRSGPGPKIFVPGRVESIENTDIKFEPRFDVELRKAGGAETVSRFEGHRRSNDLQILLSNHKSPPRKGTTRLRGSFRDQYTIRCPFCNRTFKRQTMNTRINPHKDNYGTPCSGRIGYII